MTKQEVFNIVKTGLLKQNQKSLSLEGCCAYEGEKDRHCAIGFLLPKGHPAMDYGGGLTGILREYLDLWDIIVPTNLDRAYGFRFLKQLQAVHDNDFTSEWPEALERFAAEWRLEC